jgi:hypothetical protein
MTPRRIPAVKTQYELVTSAGAGAERAHEFTADSPLRAGDLVLVAGRHWIVDECEPPDGGGRLRARVEPARYRLSLRHPDSHVEAGSFRRLRAGAPRLGHAFSTTIDGEPVSWQVVDEQPARDDEGEPYLELVAERDYSEREGIPNHELEHALAEGEALAVPARPAPGEPAGAGELVALAAGEEPRWEDAEAALDALVLIEVGENVLELCGVDPERDPPDGWLATVKQRLRSDLERFRGDVEDDHDQIEEWTVGGARIFASSGSWADERDPDKGHGWMCRLADSGVLAAAGFERLRKAEL